MGYFNSDYFEMKAVGDCDRHDSAEEDNFSQVTNFYTKVQFAVAISSFFIMTVIYISFYSRNSGA